MTSTLHHPALTPPRSPGTHARRIVVTTCVAITAAAATAPYAADAGRLGLAEATVGAIAVLAACGTVGTFLLTHLVTHAGRPRQTAPGHASTWALVWTAASLVSLSLQLPAVGATGGLDADGAQALRWSVLGLVVTAWAAAVLAFLAPRVRTSRDDRLLLLLAVGALVPSALTGHTDSTAVLAGVAVVVHVIAVTLWFGGLLALATGMDPRRTDPDLLHRFSSLALVCFVAVAGSGLVTSVNRFSVPELLAAVPYAVTLGAKIALLCVVGALGIRHRRRTLPRLVAGDPRPFWSLVAGELVVLATAAGLAVALSLTTPPVTDPAGGPEPHGHFTSP